MIDPEVPHRMRRAREAAGWSLSRLAAATHYSPATLGHMETGRRRVTRAVAAAYERILGVDLTDGRLFWCDDPVRAAHQWLLDGPHPAAAHRAAGRRVGAGLVAELDRRIVALRHADDTTPAIDLYPTVAAELDMAMSTAADASASCGNLTGLRTVVAECAQLAGWLASDLGRPQLAEAHYRTGAAAAVDRVTAAQNWSCLAYHRTNTKRPADGLLLARTAAAGAATATPLVATLLHERVAWAAAVAGDARQCRRALEVVDEAFAAASGGYQAELEPEWVYWLDRSEVDIMAARCELTLGHPDRAVPLLETALETYPDHARERGLYHSYAAEAYYALGDTGNAKRHVDILTTAAQTTSSARVDQRVGVLTGQQ